MAPRAFLIEASPNLRIALEVAWGADLTDLTGASWTWTDITDDVLLDGLEAQPITIRMGRPDESQDTQSSEFTCTLDNRASAYSQGGHSPNWPWVRRNTPVRLRVSTNAGSSWTTKYQGGVVSWQPGWDEAGKFATVVLTASDPLRQINQGTLTVSSVLFDYLTSGVESITNYWPMEEPPGATSLGEAVGTLGSAAYHYILNNTILSINTPGTFELGNGSGVPSSAPLPTFPTSRDLAINPGASGGHVVLPFPPSGTQQVTGVFDPGQGGASTILFSMEGTVGGGGYPSYINRFDGSPNRNAAMYVAYRYDVAAASTTYNGHLLLGIESSGTTTTTLLALGGGPAGNTAFNNIANVPFRWRLRWSGTQFTLGLLKLGAVTEITATGSLSLNPLTAYTYATAGTIFNDEGTPIASGGCIGHICYHSANVSLTGSANYLNAYTGETPQARVVRLANAAGMAATVRDSAVAETSANPADVLGYQYVDTLTNLLRETEATGQGVLFGGLNQGLTYVTRRLRESQQPGLTLDAAGGQLVERFPPIDDDLGTVNRAAVTRRNGPTITYVDATGPLGARAIGVYDGTLFVNPDTDGPLLRFAQWLVHLGTIPGYRYPEVRFALEWAPAKIADWLAMYPSARLDIVNVDQLRSQHPAGPVRNVLEGWTETIDQFSWRVVANCSNWSAWNVGTMAAATGTTVDTVMRRDTDGSAINTAAAAGATSISVKRLNASFPLWTTAADDFPMVVDMAGFPVTVTAISGASSPQTFTVPAGIPYAVSVNEPVQLWNPPVLGM